MKAIANLGWLPAALTLALGIAQLACNDPEAQCHNGQDDDGDGLIDCADPDCADYCDAGADGGDTAEPADSDDATDGGEDAGAADGG